jgi:hypothetical protein
MTNQISRRFFRPRFTLAALLLLITVVAIPLGYVAQRRAWNLKRKVVIENLAAKGASFQFGGLASFMAKPPPPLTWWQKLCGDLQGVTCVEIIEPIRANGSARICDEDLRQLALLPELEIIRLTAADDVTDDGLRSLAALPRLKQFLAEQLPQIDGSFLDAWAHSNQIEVLDFVRLPKLKGNHLRPLGKLTRLQSFSIFRCDSIMAADCEQVNLPAQLKYLQVGQTSFGDRTMQRWLSQTQLESLSLDVDCSRGIAPGLANQTRLKSLQIRNSPLADEDLLFLGNCPELEVLQLGGMPINGSFLKKISSDANLMLLALNCTPLAEENAAELGRFPKLINLELSWTTITGEFLAGASWPKLNRLGLFGTQFSEQGKANLALLSISGSIDYPANWSVSDLRRYQSIKPPMNIALHAAYAKQAKGAAIPVTTRFVPPEYQFNSIDRCPDELMAPVIRLVEQAREQNEKGDEGLTEGSK